MDTEYNPQWEYAVHVIGYTEEWLPIWLNEQGKDGWEFAGTVPFVYPDRTLYAFVMKRHICQHSSTS